MDLPHFFGIVPSCHALLHSLRISRASFSPPACSICAVIPSGPGLLFLFNERIASSTSEYRISCGSWVFVGVMRFRSFTMLSPPPSFLYRLSQYVVHRFVISSCDYSILPSWSHITFSRGANFLRNIFIRLYACLVFPIVRSFSTSSHCCCIQRSLSCLAAFLTSLQKFLCSSDFSLEASFVCFSFRFSSANLSVSSDIQGFFATLL